MFYFIETSFFVQMMYAGRAVLAVALVAVSVAALPNHLKAVVVDTDPVPVSLDFPLYRDANLISCSLQRPLIQKHVYYFQDFCMDAVLCRYFMVLKHNSMADRRNVKFILFTTNLPEKSHNHTIKAYYRQLKVKLIMTV